MMNTRCSNLIPFGARPPSNHILAVHTRFSLPILDDSPLIRIEKIFARARRTASMKNTPEITCGKADFGAPPVNSNESLIGLARTQTLSEI